MTDALLAGWHQTLARRGPDIAIADTGAKVLRTFAQIAAEAGRFEQQLLGELAPGSVAALQLGNHPSWPAALLACLRRGVVVLPLEQSMVERERDASLEICCASAHLSLERDGNISLMRREARPVTWGEHPPVLLKLTSGTTATPRAIRFRSGQLLADCNQICETMGIGPGDLNFGVIPISHSYGFSNLLTPLLARGVPLILSRDPMPRAVLDDLARTRATVFAGMPIFYQAFAEMDSVPALPDLRLCISAGAPLSLRVAQKFRMKFGRAIHSFYGSSECGGICYDRAAESEQPGFVGEPMEGVQLELMEPNAPASQIRVRSEATGDGYFPVPDEQKLGHGYFTPDDLISTGDAGFRIVGRLSDLINVAGKKINPAEVEAVLLGFPGIREAVVFGRSSALRNEEIVACVVADAHVGETALLEFCRQQLSGWQLPKRILFLNQLPVTERGKISRRALAARFSA